MALRAPLTAYRRHRLGPQLDPYARAMLEAQHYSGAMLDFMRATVAEPDLLVVADLDADSVVVDVGAYVGDWSDQIQQRYGCTVHAFEPSPQALPRLTERLEGRPGVHLHPFALGAVDQRAVLALDGPGASTEGQGAATFGTATIECRDVVAVFDELGLGRVDLIKVNIEGAEYDLFDRLDQAGWLDRIGSISVQFHEWHPDAYRRRRRNRRALARRHSQAWDYPWVWELWRTS